MIYNCFEASTMVDSVQNNYEGRGGLLEVLHEASKGNVLCSVQSLVHVGCVIHNWMSL